MRQRGRRGRGSASPLTERARPRSSAPPRAASWLRAAPGVHGTPRGRRALAGVGPASVDLARLCAWNTASCVGLSSTCRGPYVSRPRAICWRPRPVRLRRAGRCRWARWCGRRQGIGCAASRTRELRSRRGNAGDPTGLCGGAGSAPRRRDIYVTLRPADVPPPSRLPHPPALLGRQRSGGGVEHGRIESADLPPRA